MSAPDKIKGWVITAWVFAALYLIIGLYGLSKGPSYVGPIPVLRHVILSVFVFSCVALFGIGAMYASEGEYKTAKVLMIIGGIIALPLGVVMIIAGVKIGKAGSRGAPQTGTTGMAG